MITTSALPEQLERYGETGEIQVNIAADGHGSGYEPCCMHRPPQPPHGRVVACRQPLALSPLTTRPPITVVSTL